MSITIKDVLNLNSFKDVRILTDNPNLDQAVSWLYIVETFPSIQETIKWINDDVLLFVVGHGLLYNYFTITELVDAAKKSKASGLVFFEGEYLKEVSQLAIDYCNSQGVLAFSIPWQVKYVTINQELSNQIYKKTLLEQTTNELLQKVIFGNNLNRSEIFENAELTNINYRLNYFVMTLSIDNYEIIADQVVDSDMLTINNKIKSIICNHAQLVRYNEFVIQKGADTLLVIRNINKEDVLKIGYDNKSLMTGLQNTITSYLNKQFNLKIKITMTMGIGGTYDDFLNLKQSFRESLNVISARREKLLVNKCIQYDDLGVYKLLYAINNTDFLNEFYPDNLKNVVEYDNANGCILIPTLEKYLENKGSLNAVAIALNVHKNTVTYRLNKIKSLVEIDINRPKNIPILLLEIKAIKFLGIIKDF